MEDKQARVVSSPQKLRKRLRENRITSEYLKEHCRRHDLYMTPKFNTILYLHHKVGCGYRKVSKEDKYDIFRV